jgi:hypothetical protein
MVFNPAGSTVEPVVSTTPTVTVDPAKAAFDAATSDITNLYQTLLRRSPDKPGLDWWASVVSSGNATLQDVANQFRNSAEYKVVTAYNDVLGRYPEQAGLDWWVKQATDQNLTVDQLKNELSKTPELISKQLAPLQSKWDAEVANQEQPGIQTDIKVGQIQFGGNEWDAYRTPDGNLIIQKLNADQSGVGKGQYKGDFLDPTTGEVTTRIVDRSQMPTYGKVIMGGLLALAAANPGLFDLTGAAAGTGAGAAAGTAAGTLAPETLAALETVGQSAIPEIVATTGGLLDAGLAAGAAAGALTPTTTTTPSLTVTSTPLPATTIPAEVIAGGLGAGTLATLNNVGTQATQDLVNQAANQNINVAPTTPVVPPVVPGTPATSTIPSTVTNALGAAASGLLSGVTPNAIGNLINAGVGYQQAKQAADDLLASGQISQQQYNNLAANIQGQYNQLGNQFSGMGSDIRSTYNLLSQEAGQNVGQFTPYGVTSNLFEKSGQDIQTAAMKAAQQSFNQAGLTDVDQLSQDYYNKLSALSAPDIARQRLATEERLRAQGRLGVSGAAYGGSSPELLAQEQAIAQQQLQRELQSRQAALGERGTLLSQGAAALQPAVQLGQFGSQAAQQQFANDLARQQYLTGLKSQGVQGEIAARTQAGNLAAQGIQSAAGLQRQGLQDLLARQLMATEARSGANQRLTQSLFGGSGGSVGGVVGNALGGLFNTNAAGGINSAGFGTGLGYGNQDIGLFI